MTMHDAPALLRSNPPQRIAILRALMLGDLLVAVPAMRAIRAGFPEAEITLIGLPWASSFVCRFARYLDRFVQFAGYPGIAEVPAVPERTWRFLHEQQAYGYDLVVAMHGSGKTSLPLALELGGRMTAGYYVDFPPPGLTVGALYPDDRPEILRNLELACLLGCPDTGTDLEFPIFEEDHAEARTLLSHLSPLRPWVALHPGARHSSRRWPAEHFSALGDALIDEFGAQIVLTGGQDEVEVTEAVAVGMSGPALNLAGKTSLGSLGATLSRLDLFIGNDTGPGHIAAALDVPSISIFGPADHRRWGHLEARRHPVIRRGVACSPCEYTDCPIDHRCLRGLQPESVLDLAGQLLMIGGVACSA